MTLPEWVRNTVHRAPLFRERLRRSAAAGAGTTFADDPAGLDALTCRLARLGSCVQADPAFRRDLRATLLSTTVRDGIAPSAAGRSAPPLAGAGLDG